MAMALVTSGSLPALRSSTFLGPPLCRICKGNEVRLDRIATRPSLVVRAAKLPTGVEAPREEPKLPSPFLGFTRTAEIWNSRACMIGLIGTFIVELLIRKGILQVVGIEIGKGLDLPL